MLFHKPILIIFTAFFFITTGKITIFISCICDFGIDFCSMHICYDQLSCLNYIDWLKSNWHTFDLLLNKMFEDWSLQHFFYMRGYIREGILLHFGPSGVGEDGGPTPNFCMGLKWYPILMVLTTQKITKRKYKSDYVEKDLSHKCDVLCEIRTYYYCWYLNRSSINLFELI